MCCTLGFGHSDQKVERVRRAPRYWPCPKCGKKGKRKTTVERPLRGLGFGGIVLVILTVGVYRARCGCCKTFQSDHRRAPKGWRYTREVRQVVLDSVVRDRMPVDLVKQRLEEDFSLRISTGFVYQCVEWGYAQLDQEAYRAWALANFSGVLCIDELHDSRRRKLLLATDPINDFTVAFRITKKCDQEAMNGFLDELKALGFEPEVVITDGSSLYKEALFERWSDVEHQLCIFHVLKGANEYILRAVRALAKTLPKPKKYPQGRPKKRGRPRQPDTRRKFIMSHVHLVVKRKDRWSEEDRETWQEMTRILPELKTLRRFVDRFCDLFRRDSTKAQARRRRQRLVNDPSFQDDANLKKVLRMIPKDKFEKMLTFLGWEDGERTSNHVERNNRTFRMMQKTRYKRRRRHTITRALWLSIVLRWKRHPLYDGGTCATPDGARSTADSLRAAA